MTQFSCASKPRLRTLLRERRQQLDIRTRNSAALAACEHFTTLPAWLRALRIALYMPMDAEIDTAPLAARCRAAAKQLFLPVMGEDKRLDFAGWEEDTPLHRNGYGIAEPPATAPRVEAGELDIVVLPLVGWDRQGSRLGMGGGYYDRSLAGINGPLLAGLAYSVQEVPHIPWQEWDIPLDVVVTESGTYRGNRNRAAT